MMYQNKFLIVGFTVSVSVSTTGQEQILTELKLSRPVILTGDRAANYCRTSDNVRLNLANVRAKVILAMHTCLVTYIYIVTYIWPTKFSDVGFCATKFKLCPTKIKSDRTNVLSSQIFICSPAGDLSPVILSPGIEQNIIYLIVK